MMNMAKTVYILAAILSLGCTLMLFRGYRRSRTRFLFWSSLSFVGLTLNIIILFVDMVIFPEIDLSWWGDGAVLVSLFLILYGLLWDIA